MTPRKLSLYNKKRDFKKTAEPSGKVARSTSGFSYLIQKHAATRLHYDFRLELDGVLKSWAVTRGPSLDPADKRLAVEVEDHPVAYGDFEGTIPKGEYGGGTVMLWDQGSWEPLGDPKKDLKNGSLKFRLKGKRLKGEWALVRMKARPQDKGRNNWLLIKHDDAYAKRGQGEAYLEKNNTSITTKRKMDAIAQARDRVWGKTESASKPATKKKPVKTKKASKLPNFIAPQLATLVTEMPTGKEWIHEVKFDGYRVLAYLNDGTVTMYTRNGLDWTKKFGPVPGELAKLDCYNAILDGELVALNDKHISSFSALKQSLSESGDDLTYYAFDLLYLNGEDLRTLPLLARKKQLSALLDKRTHAKIFLSEHFSSHDDSFYQKACSLSLEGVISKRADAPYHSGRGGDWLKTKCHKRQEFVIGGYTSSTASASMIGSLLLGYYEGKDFVYAGRVGTGFDHKMAHELMKTLKKLTRKTMPYTKYSDAGRRGPGWKRGVFWTEPKLVCEVEFTEWTEDGALRHPSFQGMREDKPANKITRDIPIAPKQAAKKTAATRSPHRIVKSEPVIDDNVTLTHPEKVLFPNQHYTKQDLSDYYQKVAEWMLPYVANRGLSLVRCPSGSTKPCFFQRHADKGLSPHIRTLKIGPKTHDPYLVIDDAEGLQALVQMGVLETHIWGSKANEADRPDFIVFDLDPDPSVAFTIVKKAALAFRARLKKLKLESFVKTTGGKGLHVVVPITPKLNWDDAKAWARRFAQMVEDEDPDHFTTNMRKVERKNRIFIDYLRNGETATAIAPYSTRARDGAPVSVPLTWKELPKVKAANQWNIDSLPKRLAKLRTDPWEDFLHTKQTLPKLPQNNRL
ncbi:DNA ligase D [bacterium]|nr:DNA ligase D [bacterium]